MATNDLAVQLQLDLAPYRAGLEAMVASTREAAAQAGAQMAAGLAGLDAPAVDLSGLQRVMDQAQADFAALRAQASAPIQLPPLVPPPPATIPAPKVEAPVVPAPDTTSLAAVRTQVQTMLKEPFERAGLTLDDVRKAKAALDRQLQSAATSETRGEILGLTSQLGALELEMKQVATATATLHPASKQAASGMSAATQTAGALGYATNDLAVASIDLRMGIMGVSNNLPQIIQGFAAMKVQAAATGVAVRTQMLAALAGPGGLILGVTALTTALPFLISWLGREKDAHEDTAKGVKAHRDEVNGLIRDLQRLAGAQAYSAVQSSRTQLDQIENQLRATDGAIGRRQKKIAEIIDRERRARGLSKLISDDLVKSFLDDDDLSKIAEYRRQIEIIRDKGVTVNGEEIESRDVLLQRQRELTNQIAITSARERDNLGFRLGALQDEQRQLAENATQTQAQADRQADVNSQIRETQRLMDQRMGTGDFDPDKQARASAALDRARAAQERKDTAAAERALKEARRIAGIEIELGDVVVQASRLGSEAEELQEIALAEERVGIAEAMTRDQIAVMRDGYAKRSALARLEVDRDQLLADLRRQRANVERVAAVAAAEAERSLAVRRAGATITNQAELARTIAAADATRDAALEEAARAHQLALIKIDRQGVESRVGFRSAVREAELAKDRVVLDGIKAQMEGFRVESRKSADKLLAEAERAQQRLQQLAERTRQAVSRTLGDVLGGATSEAQYSDAERDEKRDKLAAEEADLFKSLDRRRIGQEEYDRKLRALRLERSEFEKQVSKDERSAVVRGAEAGYMSLRGMLEDWLKEYAAKKLTELVFHTATEEGKTLVTLSGTAQRLALGAKEIAGDLAKAGASMVSAAAKWIADAVGKLGIFSVAAIPAGVAGLYGAYQGAKALFGFRVGGHTGAGADGDVAGVVHRNEVVLEAGIVRGQVGDVLALRSLLQSGVSAADLVALAGAPDAASLASVAAVASAVPAAPAFGPGLAAPASVDLSGIERSFERLAAEVARMKSKPPPTVIGEAEVRLLASEIARGRATETPPAPRRIRTTTLD